jgi:hypothetical protein
MIAQATPRHRTLSRGDRASIVAFMVAGVALVAWAITDAVLRISSALNSSNVSVLGQFAGTPGQAPIGPGGSLVEIELDRAVLTTSALPTASLVSLVTAETIAAATVTTVVVCLLLLSVSVLSGDIFSRRNTALVATAGITGLVGAAAAPFFSNMAANGAFAAISEREFVNVVISVEPLPYVLGAFVIALIATAFSVGERLQRDTAGLV